MERLTNEELLQLLHKAIDEEIELRNTLRSTMNTYITLILSIIAGVLTISSVSSVAIIMPLAFVLGGILCCYVSLVGFQHYKSDYIRQVECIVEQAKLQDILGLTDPMVYRMRTYWKGESLLPESFIRTRKECKTSEEFIKWFVKYTDTKWVRVLYICFVVLGVFLCGMGIWLVATM